MANTHRGATLTPSFREFLPSWIERQPWYQGAGTPGLRPIGTFRFEDPAGEVGIETHLVTDDSELYHIPMTYRDAPIGDDHVGDMDPLVVVAQHSALGTRWIYDAVADPVWRDAVLRLVRSEGVSDSSGRSGVGQAAAKGHLLSSDGRWDAAIVEIERIVTAEPLDDIPGTLGALKGTWYPNGPEGGSETGPLAIVRGPM